MSLEFLRPRLLWLLPAYIALVYWIDRRYRRGDRRLKRRVALAVRCVLTCLCVLALAAPSVLLPGGNGAVWILTDVSASTQGVQEQITQSVQTALDNRSDRLDVGVIAFGGNAMVETPLSAAPVYEGARTAVDPQNTLLSQALTLAGALLPAEASGRIAVLSDGKTDDIRAAASALAARGVKVDVMAFSAAAASDAQVTKVALPATAFAGQSFSVTVRVDSTLDTRATLVLYQNRAPVATREVTLRRGENTFVFRDTAAEAGIVTYEARLVAEGDERAQNDSQSGYLYVQGAPRLLLVEGRTGEGSEMSEMLLAAGMAHERVLPDAMPASADGYMSYDAIVLVNVDYDSAGEAQWRALSDAVRALGRGLCVVGGDSSYALGNYRGSLLEEMLPVTIDVRSQMELPSLALILVIDHSGSMASGMFGATRIEMAKEAAMRAVELLTEKDQVGVIAFDDTAKWVTPLQAVTDVQAIQAQIGTIRADGGTAFYSALYEALQALQSAQARQKHVIFLTDGEAGDSGYEALAQQMAEQGITLTTVAIGSGANRTLLARLAQLGEGRAYAADEFDNLPKIFAKETYLASGSYVQNRVFTPVVAHDSVLTDFDGFPQMTGYLAATEKGLATVELCSDREDPILAWWQYGAGRVLCFMGDSRGAWTQALLSWDQAAAFYGGMAAYVLPQEQREGELTVARENGALQIAYTAPENASGCDTRALALLPDGEQTELALEETAPGVYTGLLPAAQQGAYALRVEQRDETGTLLHAMEGGAVAGYSPEYDLRAEEGESTLPLLASLTGGRVVADAAQLLRQEGGVSYRRVELIQPLLWILLAMMVVDIALRRLSWDTALARRTSREAEKAPRPAPERAARRAPKRRAAGEAHEEASATAQKLLDAKRNKKIL